MLRISYCASNCQSTVNILQHNLQHREAKSSQLVPRQAAISHCYLKISWKSLKYSCSIIPQRFCSYVPSMMSTQSPGKQSSEARFNCIPKPVSCAQSEKETKVNRMRVNVRLMSQKSCDILTLMRTSVQCAADFNTAYSHEQRLSPQRYALCGWRCVLTEELACFLSSLPVAYGLLESSS